MPNLAPDVVAAAPPARRRVVATAAVVLAMMAALAATPPPAAGLEEIEKVVVVAGTGAGNRAAFSDDAVVWEQAVTTDRVWTDVAYSAPLGRFVAAGTDGWTMRSDDGVSWNATQVAGLGSASLNRAGVVYGGGLFVVTGDEVGAANCANCLASSPDGITWTLRNAGANDASVQAIGHSGTQFLAAGHDGTSTFVSISSDGLSWTQSTASLGGTLEPTGVASSGSTWIMVGNAGTADRLHSSNDGTTWVGRTGDNTRTWQAVTFGDGRFVAAAANTFGVSSGGVTWQTITVPGGWTDVAWVPGLELYVAVSSDSAEIATSPDAQVWTVSSPLPSALQYRGIATGFADAPATPETGIVSILIDSVASIFGEDAESAGQILGIILFAILLWFGAKIGVVGVVVMAAAGAAALFRLGLLELWVVIVVVLLSLAFVAKRLG